MTEKTDYGNWVPERMFLPIFGAAAVLAAAALILWLAAAWPVPAVVCAVLAVMACAFGIYMFVCHEIFAFGKGNMMAKVHQYLVEHLDLNGQGKLLDIGCGAGALTIRCAKAFPQAQLVGMDYWGKEWNYAKEQCERNAALEQVADRVEFVKGDASKLAWPNESFDAVVSNFVFHEVKTAPHIRFAYKSGKKGGGRAGAGRLPGFGYRLGGC